MRQLLVTALLIIVILVIYNRTIGGEEGTKSKVIDSGVRVGTSIQSINP